jgi:hypothetical protein
MHQFERLLPQTLADRYGHDGAGHDRPPTGIELDHQIPDRRVDLLSAFWSQPTFQEADRQN